MASPNSGNAASVAHTGRPVASFMDMIKQEPPITDDQLSEAARKLVDEYEKGCAEDDAKPEQFRPATQADDTGLTLKGPEDIWSLADHLSNVAAACKLSKRFAEHYTTIVQAVPKAGPAVGHVIAEYIKGLPLDISAALNEYLPEGHNRDLTNILIFEDGVRGSASYILATGSSFQTDCACEDDDCACFARARCPCPSAQECYCLDPATNWMEPVQSLDSDLPAAIELLRNIAQDALQ